MILVFNLAYEMLHMHIFLANQNSKCHSRNSSYAKIWNWSCLYNNYLYFLRKSVKDSLY